MNTFIQHVLVLNLTTLVHFCRVWSFFYRQAVIAFTKLYISVWLQFEWIKKANIVSNSSPNH